MKKSQPPFQRKVAAKPTMALISSDSQDSESKEEELLIYQSQTLAVGEDGRRNPTQLRVYSEEMSNHSNEFRLIRT